MPPLIALLILTVFAPAQGKAEPLLPERGSQALQAHAVDQMMRDFVHEHRLPGGSLAIMKDGELLYARAFGWADPDKKIAARPASLYRIASISKPITAVAVLRLVDQGKLDLQESPFERIGLAEELKHPSRDPRLEEITIEQLLHHRAGWDRGQSFDPMFVPQRVRDHLGSEGPPDQHQIIRFMLDQNLDHDPGTQYAYSNFGYCLLGRVIESCSGMSYEQFVLHELLTPLGITSMRIGRSLPAQAWADEVRYVDGSGRKTFAA
ncbi:MAG: beta-lactamase family protein, partial [Planctomycetes bacterium]|nr:beta-lactamase family protein [Planctomycetota bacterium]